MGNAVFVAFFFAFLFLGGFAFATSSGMVALSVAAVDVLDALLLLVDAVDVPAMALFGGRLLIVADFVFVLVFFFCLGFIDAIGSSSEVESVDPCILIKRSMFCRVLLCVWARAYSADWSIFTTVVVHGGVQVLCCKQF